MEDLRRRHSARNPVLRVPEIFDVYRLDTATGEMDAVAENPGDHEEWFADHEGKLRVAVTTDGVYKSLLYRETEDADWREVASYSFKEGASPLLFTFDNQALYVSSNVGRDKSAIFEYDLAAGRERRRSPRNDPPKLPDRARRTPDDPLRSLVPLRSSSP